MIANTTYIIQKKLTGEQWVADSGKSSWKKPGHAKSAWKGSIRNIPEEFRLSTKYSWKETVRFDDQEVFEIVELQSEDFKKLDKIRNLVDKDKILELRSDRDLDTVVYLLEETMNIVRNSMSKEQNNHVLEGVKGEPPKTGGIDTQYLVKTSTGWVIVSYWGSEEKYSNFGIKEKGGFLDAMYFRVEDIECYFPLV